MITSLTEIRVRYAETDQMGFVYYGNYSIYFEVARVETLRNLGISYKEMEESGISLPVLEYKVKYIRPAFYDEILTVQTSIPVMPSARILFQYETRNQKNELINTAETTLVFVSTQTMKPCPPPAFVIEKLTPFFSELK